MTRCCARISSGSTRAPSAPSPAVVAAHCALARRRASRQLCSAPTSGRELHAVARTNGKQARDARRDHTPKSDRRAGHPPPARRDSASAGRLHPVPISRGSCVCVCVQVLCVCVSGFMRLCLSHVTDLAFSCAYSKTPTHTRRSRREKRAFVCCPPGFTGPAARRHDGCPLDQNPRRSTWHFGAHGLPEDCDRREKLHLSEDKRRHPLQAVEAQFL